MGRTHVIIYQSFRIKSFFLGRRLSWISLLMLCSPQWQVFRYASFNHTNVIFQSLSVIRISLEKCFQIRKPSRFSKTSHLGPSKGIVLNNKFMLGTNVSGPCVVIFFIKGYIWVIYGKTYTLKADTKETRVITRLDYGFNGKHNQEVMKLFVRRMDFRILEKVSQFRNLKWQSLWCTIARRMRQIMIRESIQRSKLWVQLELGSMCPL